MIVDALGAALERAAAALQADDAPAAATALADACRCCGAARDAGLRIDPAQLATLRELHARGAAEAQRAQRRLLEKADAAGAARRAVAAYHR